MIPYFTVVIATFISLTALASERSAWAELERPVCESIIVQTEDKLIKDNEKRFFELAYEGPRVVKGNRAQGFLDDSNYEYDAFYGVFRSGDQSRLTGFDANGAAAIGKLENVLTLRFKPLSEVAKKLSINYLVVFCGTDKELVLEKRADYAERHFLILRPFTDIQK